MLIWYKYCTKFVLVQIENILRKVSMQLDINLSLVKYVFPKTIVIIGRNAQIMISAKYIYTTI